jgi:hypothetical protein
LRKDIAAGFAAQAQDAEAGPVAVRKDVVIWLGSAIAAATALIIGAIQLG